MTDLFLGRRKINTLFELLGEKENDITYSLGWSIAESNNLLKEFLEELFPKLEYGETESIKLQTYNIEQGITDIEIRTSRLHLIIEAKRGWNLPREKQLRKYAHRFQDTTRHRAIAVIAECSADYARQHLRTTVKGIPVHYLSWKQVTEMVNHNRHHGRLAERRLLDELHTYLRGVMHMQDHETNMVYVVSLGSGRPNWSKLSWVEFVTKRRCYFHPNGRKGWAKVPPNYVAFRYKGRLQHIHHVDSVEVVADLSEHFPEIDKAKWRARKDGTHFLYKLGRPIAPLHTVKSGGVYANARLWAALDLLLTSPTVKEAVDLTKKRAKKG